MPLALAGPGASPVLVPETPLPYSREFTARLCVGDEAGLGASLWSTWSVFQNGDGCSRPPSETKPMICIEWRQVCGAVLLEVGGNPKN